jgi:ribosomal protein L32E
MAKTGYKATRKGVAQRRRETREKIWRNADVPPAWEEPVVRKELMREMLKSSPILDQAVIRFGTNNAVKNLNPGLHPLSASEPDSPPTISTMIADLELNVNTD